MKRVCGLDVHKDTILCATDNGKKFEEFRFLLRYFLILHPR
jgi:hypothetical protein